MAYISDSEHQARLVRMASLAGSCAHELDLDEAAQETLEKETEESRREVGYASRLLVQVTLPHSKPAAGVFTFERSNGFVTVKVVADPEYGLPYGTYPRLLQAWITTEAVRMERCHECATICRGFLHRQYLRP